MPDLKLILAAAFAAFVLPAAAQTGGSPALVPPDQLFAPQQPGKFQSLYNEASLCSGLTAQLQASAAMYAARALTESTRARRAGDENAAADMQSLFTTGTSIRDTASSAHQTLESFRTTLSGLDSVSDAGGRILFIAGGRRVTPLPLNSLPPGGKPLSDAMIGHANTLLDSLGAVHICLETVGSVDVTSP